MVPSCQGHDGKRPQLYIQYQRGPVPPLAVNFRGQASRISKFH